MTRRITYRGRNYYISDGRPAGHGAKLETKDEGMRPLTFASIAIATGALLYFGGKLALCVSLF